MGDTPKEWPKRDEGEPTEPFYKRLFGEAILEIDSVTEEEITKAGKELPELHAAGMEEVGICPPDLQKVYAYIQRLNDQYGYEEGVPLSVRTKRQLAFFASNDQLGKLYPTDENDEGQVFVIRGWRIVYVPANGGSTNILPFSPVGRA